MDKLPEVMEVPFSKVTSGEIFPHDNKSHPYEIAEAAVKAEFAMYEKLLDTLHGDNLYIKLTAGQRAGTIARIEDYQFDTFFYINSDRGDTKSTRLEIKHRQDYTSSRRVSLAAAATTIFRESGAFYCDKIPSLHSSFYGSWHGDDKIPLVVDGKGVIVTFSTDDAFMESARPVILVGYNGPTVWKFSRRVHSNPKIVLQDRFGTDVTEGDLVILATRPAGLLLVGKITSISPKMTLTMKHLGADVPHQERNINSNQLMRVKDLENTLMLMRLSSL